jgi:putative endonuclease
MKAWTYITTNKYNKVIYTGVTSNLKSRMESHKTKKYPNAFTARYNANKLVWFQEFDSIIDAREREKQIKAGSRAKKINLIEALNPDWKDLCKTL